MLSEVILLILLSVLFIGSYIKSESNNKTVSAVIPAFNESKTLKHVIDTVKQVPEIQEIIVVDDGSSDNTFEIAKNEGVIALQHKKNKGKGSAMKTGLKSVHGDIVLFLDADLSKINKSQVKAIIEPILKGNADITKIAMTKLRKAIKQYEKEHNDGKYLAHVALQVYDELLLDVPEHLADVFEEMMDRCMIEAGEEVIKNVPVETGCVIADHWVKG